MPRAVFKIVLFIVVLAAGIGGFIYLKTTKPAGEPVKTEEKSWPAQTQTVTPQTLAPALTLYGRAESPRTVTLEAALAAEAQAVPVLEGQQVEAGAVLAQLDERDVRLLLQQREADVSDIAAQINNENNAYANHLASLPREQALLELSRRAAERALKLEKQQAGSQSARDESLQAVERQQLAINSRQLEIKNHAARLEQLQARLNKAQALRDQAKLDLSRAQITAPFAATIAKVSIAPGDRVRVGDAMIVLYDHQALEARAQIPDRYLAIVAAGNGLQASGDASGSAIGLRLNRLAGEARANGGGVEALFAVTRGQDKLRAGQFVTLRLALPPQDNAVALPFEAVYGNQRVYKLVGGRMRGVAVEFLGEWVNPDGKALALLRGAELQAGDVVVTTQLPNAIEGLKIQASQ
jgi:multidrug efflux pump subunit AcrA (membrane-fusion protein)